MPIAWRQEGACFGEDRGISRILRRLKLHAEGRQFGDQNSRTRRSR
jgi:hypothetical protein